MKTSPVLILAALPLFPRSALHAEEPPQRPAAKETDSRLQSDGKGWRLDRAKITDPSRARVLLIGDSILNGYLKAVTASLRRPRYSTTFQRSGPALGNRYGINRS